MSFVLVTGATGNVGREVVRALRARGIPLKVAVREPAAEPDAVALDYRDPRTFACSEGARAIFLLRPPAIADVDTTLLPFVDEARRRGVQHVVFLSVTGADTNRFVPHHAVEQHLVKAAGWTILRPGFFAQNFQDAYRRDIVEDGRVYVPAGDGKAAFVDVRDVAQVAAAVFAAPEEHDRHAYTLTGGEAVDFSTAASLLSSAVGRPIHYVRASIPGYVLHLRRRALPWGQAVVQTVLHVGLRFGQAERVDPTLPRLLGRPAGSLGAYFEAERSVWAGAARA